MMAVSLSLRSLDESWREPGCTDRCWQRWLTFAGDRYQRLVICHDLATHRAYDAEQARQLDPSTVVETGCLRVDGTEKRVWVGDHEIPFTPTELAIVLSLAAHLGQPRSSNDILEDAWGPAYRDDGHLLRVNIARVRAKLGPARELLQTRPGLGYLLARAPVLTVGWDGPAGLLMPRARAQWPLGPRSLALLTLLRASPERGISVNAACQAIYGVASARPRKTMLETVRRLKQRGYPVAIEWDREDPGANLIRLEAES